MTDKPKHEAECTHPVISDLGYCEACGADMFPEFEVDDDVEQVETDLFGGVDRGYRH